MRWASALLLLALATPASAQEPGWHYSPLSGEGDRAALGCNREASADDYLCLAVRCEDDYSVGLHLHSSRPDGGVGRWTLTIDRELTWPLAAEAATGPYSSRVSGDVNDVIDALKDGGIAYLDADDGSLSAQIRLNGSLPAINRALFFCAPRVPTEAGEPEE